ncbi:hypothetical protein JIN85_18525 [Luteolibacter pohnpeiensis]|uniref:TraG P-loop domain-containing protein n=1 Tax=Luteolibacter pohnpeiensis TaxID=454153 RepID=A0A934VYD5_9BACT|nr:hypothetical protein [Luteolibacter pohnpeiensis]MBK1884419.1 hypothetical protein [Luteolibacter pohnpeiensis]
MINLTDGFVSHGQIVWCPNRSQVFVSRLLEVSAPSLETASVEYCNQLEIEISVILHMLPDEVLMQAVWMQDLDHGPLLKKYYKDTLDFAKQPWVERERNAIFVEQMERDQRGELRGERLLISLRMPLGCGSGEVTDELLTASHHGFDLWISEIKGAIGRIGGIAEEPDENRLFQIIRKYVDPVADLDPYAQNDPSGLSLCDTLPGDFVGEEGLGFYCGGLHHGFVALSVLPQATYSGIIAQILNVPFRNYGLTLNIRSLDPAKELEETESKKSKLERALRSGRNTRLEHSISALRNRIQSLASGEAHPVKIQMIVRAHDANAELLRSKLIAVRNAIGRMQGAAGVEIALPTTARNLFLAGMPGAPIVEEAFWHKVDDVVAANLIPLTGDAGRSLEQAQAIFQTSRGGLFGVRIFGGKEGHEYPRHAFVTGMTGSGKSAFLISLLTQSNPFVDYTVIIDDGLSYASFVSVTTGGKVRPLILGVGCNETLNYWDTGGLPSEGRHVADIVAVLHLMAGYKSDEDADRLREALLESFVVRFRAEWAEKWLGSEGGRKASIRQLLRALIRFAEENSLNGDLAEKYSRFHAWAVQNPIESQAFVDEMPPEDEDLDENLLIALSFARMSPEDMPTHTCFHDWLKKETSSQSSHESEVQMLITLLGSWRSDHGAKGALLDGINTVDLSAPCVHLELGKLGETDEALKALVSYVISSKVRNEITKRPRSQKKRIVIEELGAFIKLKGGERMVRDFYERMRKNNAWVVSVCQQVSSLPESMARSILGNTRLAFLFRQKEQRDLDALQRAFHLPGNAIDAIRRFGEPTVEYGAPFLCWEGLNEHDRVTFATNRATPEMLYVSASSGEHFEQRAMALSKYEDVLEGVIAEARKS